MKRWISHPERYPHRCPWSHQDSPDDGPYLDAGLLYFAAREIDGRIEPDRRESALYISPQALIEAAQLPGSPLAIKPIEVWQRVESEAHEIVLAFEDAQARIAELEAELAEAKGGLRGPTPASAEAIAAEVAELLGDTFAKKPGPKPKASA